MVSPGKPPVDLTAADADIIWRFDPMDELAVRPHNAASSSVLIHGDVLYVGTANGVNRTHDKVLSPAAPSLIALDKRTGRLLAADNEQIGTRLYHGQWSSPSLGKVGGKTLVFFAGGDGVCYAFEALSAKSENPVHLKKVWSYNCNPPHYRLRDGKAIPYYEGDVRKSYSTNENDGQYVGPSQIIATPVFHDDRVYLAIGQDPAHGRGKGMLHCIDAAKTGDVTETGCMWTYDEMDRSISTVAVAGGLVYAPDIAGRLHCVDGETGQRRWVFHTKAEVWGGPLVADGKVYLGNKRELFVLAAGDEPNVLSRIRLGSPIYSTPIAANGVLYIASQRYLWAVRRLTYR
jgi:outer membrane protein assembly factor BamB